MRVAIILGTRPEILKNYTIVAALRKRGIPFWVLHTNQHAEPSMAETIFREVGYQPDYALEPPYAMGKAVDWTIGLIRKLKVNLVLVNGDTAAALVGALAAVYTDTSLAHVEAGLRSFDQEMLEERNRIMVDACAHYLFAYTIHEKAYLEAAARDRRGTVHFVGNPTVDLIRDFRHKIRKPSQQRYLYVTLHRKEFTDRPERMRDVFATLGLLAERFEKVIFPMHPRTRDAMRRHGMDPRLLRKVEVLEPVSGFQSLSFIRHAAMVLTDSGCVQEEAYIFEVPCVTVRDNTERHLTVQHGRNILAGFSRDAILGAIDRHERNGKAAYPPIYAKYGVGTHIVEILLEGHGKRRSRLADESQGLADFPSLLGDSLAQG